MNLTHRSMLRAIVAMMLLPVTRVWTATRGADREIKRSGSQPSTKGPAVWFTGTVRIDPLFDAQAPARGGGKSVRFEPGAKLSELTGVALF